MFTPDLDLQNVADVLGFAAKWEGREGAKASAIRKHFGCAPARYYQALASHLTTREALEHDPALTHRLNALHERRAASRASRTFRL